MATTDTGPLGTLTFISAEPVDPDSTGEKWLRVRYSLDTTSATEALTGFLIWHDDEVGSTTPVWVDAADASVAGGGDGGTPTVYEVLVSVPLTGGVATWWETFEEYAVGAVGVMDKGGAGWSGAAAVGEGFFWIHASENFESYSTGTIGILNGGIGWDGPAVIGEVV